MPSDNEDVENQKKIVANPTYEYFEREEKVHGYLSKQFPTIANPAPLGLCAFAMTVFVLSMMNAGTGTGEDVIRLGR